MHMSHALVVLMIASATGSVHAHAEEVCQTELPLADKALSLARAQGDRQATQSARDRLERALSKADRCPVVATLYRAHVAESRCDGAGALRAYAEYLRREPSDRRSQAAVQRTLLEIAVWQSTQLTVHSADASLTGLELQVSCRWAPTDSSVLTCEAVASGPELSVSRPTTAHCEYTAVAPNQQQTRGELTGQPVIKISLNRLPSLLPLTAALANESQAGTSHTSKTAPQVAAPPIDQAPARPWQRPLSYVLAGVGLVSLGAGSYFGLRAISDDTAADKLCPGSGSSCADPTGRSHAQQANDSAVHANTFLLSGVLAAGAGVVLWLTAPAQPSAHAAGSGVQLGGAHPLSLRIGGSF